MRATASPTVVITGASSGIGRATAERFARQGARLVLASRGEAALEVVCAECRRLGAQVIGVPTDVTDPRDMQDLADRAAAFAASHGGQIDVWVSNAGVGAAGAIEDTPAEAHEQIIRTNLLGYLLGARAVVPYFKKAGKGTLIQVLSLGAWSPTPMATSYTASKYGLRGFSEALRLELAPWPHIHVCDIFPMVVDSPGFAHGANYTGKVIKPPPPRADPRAVARAIVHAAHSPHRRSTAVGVMATLSRIGNIVSPTLLRLGSSLFVRGYLRVAPPAPKTDGNLFRPSTGNMSIDGGWRDRSRVPAVGMVAAGATLFVAAAWLLRRHGREG
ncbi:SDR family oxidoreductase [Cupriavidus plantarum]|uniref:Short-subunit dehydrogenase n=1 Tax=Cupriavidus plantarum TaxID=942865 RepID=A0A316EYI5_9BURK|nr:SDR family oxidoreductase [Cupriavidus plantarum]PWK36409.1 short-subunit dehydrogenase [Cupriavidus plantarum]